MCVSEKGTCGERTYLPCEKRTHVAHDVVAERGMHEARGGETARPIHALLRPAAPVCWLAREQVHDVACVRTFQHQSLVAGTREALVQRLEQKPVEAERLTEARHEVRRDQLHLVLHNRHNLQQHKQLEWNYS